MCRWRSEGYRRVSQAGLEEGEQRVGREKGERTPAAKGRASVKALGTRRNNSRFPRIAESRADGSRWNSEWLPQPEFHFYFIPFELHQYFMKSTYHSYNFLKS